MNDHRNPAEPTEPDATAARLRRGLDHLTASVSDDPPGLDASVTAAPRPGDSIRYRWLAAAAAAIVVVGAGAGAMYFLGSTNDIGAPSDTGGERAEREATGVSNQRPGTTKTATTGDDTRAVTIFEDDDSLSHTSVGHNVEGVLTIESGCLMLSTNDGQRYVPLWPAGTRWNMDPDAVVLPDGTSFALGEQIQTIGGQGVPRTEQTDRWQWCVDDLDADGSFLPQATRTFVPVIRGLMPDPVHGDVEPEVPD